MKKNIFKFIIGVILCISINLICITKIDAASATIKVSSNRSQVIVGNSFTVTVTVSSSTPIGSWEFTINYDKSKLRLTSGENRIVDYGNGTKTSQSYTYTFRAIASGRPNISVKAYNVLAWNESSLSTTVKSATIKTLTQAELEASYSKDNNLKSLSVNGFELTPAFNKDTTEYEVSLTPDTEKITVNAEVNDSKATVTGTGEIAVSEGENKIELIVTAENGNEKKYTIIATVEDTNPIVVKSTDGETLTVVKRATTLTKPSTYTETKITLNSQEIPAFYSEITNFTLVGLKDNKGNINLYIYDETNNTYKLYTEVEFNKLTIYPIKAEKIPENYKETTIIINEKEIVAYKTNEKDEFSLIYGVNIETGKTHFYQYDPLENTISRYNDTIINDLTKKLENYFFIIVVLCGETVLLLLILLILISKRNKSKKLMKRLLEEKKDRTKEKKEKVKIEKIDTKELTKKQKKLTNTQKLDQI